MPPHPHSANNETSVSRYADDAANRLYQRVWGGRIHFGLWLSDNDTMATAAARVPMTLARDAGVCVTDNVVEVGSGAARTAIDLARTFGCRIVATNHSPAHKQLADRAIAEAGFDHLISSATADAEQMPFDDGRFSVYWAQEVLVHLGDKAAGFSEAHRVLSRCGRIVFTEQTSRPGRMTTGERSRVAARHGSDDLWDRGDFVEAMEAAGFGRTRTADWSTHLAVHFAALCRRIDDNRAELERDCGTALVARQLDNWRFAQALAREGKIGWHLFIGHKS
ncbi:MAG: methyltransferase domain-containing protein [Rhodospirillales bacterium]